MELSSAQRSPGRGWGPGLREGGPGKKALVAWPARVSLCSQRHVKGAPQPGGKDAFKEERKTRRRGLQFLEARAVFAPNTDTDPLLALSWPLPIFRLFLEEPVPQPRVAELGTPVRPAAGPGAGHPPRASSLATFVPAELPPRPGCGRRWPSVGLR